MSIGKGSRIKIEDRYTMMLGAQMPALDMMVLDLAERKLQVKEEFWKIVMEDHPELEEFHASYDWRTQMVTVIRKKSKDKKVKDDV
jgi:hypothetical protein